MRKPNEQEFPVGYVAMPSDNCVECAFYPNYNARCWVTPCIAEDRTDGQDVIFKKIGESNEKPNKKTNN